MGKHKSRREIKGLWEKGEKPECRGKMESDLVAGGGGYQAAGGQVGGQGAEGQSRSCTASNAEIPRRHGEGAETPGKKGHDFSDAKAVQSRKPKKLLTKDKSFTVFFLSGCLRFQSSFGNTAIGLFVVADAGRNWKSGCDKTSWFCLFCLFSFCVLMTASIV